MNLSRGWTLFFFVLNVFFVLMWTMDLVGNILLRATHNPAYSQTHLIMDLIFSVLNIFFATLYQRALWPKST